MKTLNELNKQLKTELDKSVYFDKKLVFGDGNQNTKIFLIGEAPGGKNLDEFMEIVGLDRKDIYISNVVKFRPTNLSPKTGKPVNRTPNSNEIKFFLPFLMEEIEIVSPDLVVTLGNVPLKAILNDNNKSIGDLHGTLIETTKFKLFPLYHPASIIYNRSLKEVYLDDLERIKEVL